MSIPKGNQFESARNSVAAAAAAGQLTQTSVQNIDKWLTEPFYAEYRDQLIGLIDHKSFPELDRLFWERIPFGTGGRRGPMSDFGSATINARTIAESANGLAIYVQRTALPSQLGNHNDPKLHGHQRGDSTGQSPQPGSTSFNHGQPDELRAVIACDTRHRSMEFARLTASVLAAHGFQVFFFTEPRATPELSFAVRHLKCDTGVMISASHNPPSDNGFKAYWSTGGQVLSPHDRGIIDCVDASEDIPKIDFEQGVKSGKIVLLGNEDHSQSVDQAYIDAVCALSLSQARTIKALYTPMHGVGESSIYRVIRQLGYRDVEIFEDQRSQDGSFPNVPGHLPNPERPQALQPAIEYAKHHGHSLVMASDPDADRLAVAVRTQGDEFLCLNGNQLAALLADYVLSKRAAAGTLSKAHFIVETLVTTPLLVSIGEAYGVRVIRDLLVGFKYIAAAVDANGPDKFVFAAEESVGYLAGSYCRDKDASVAAVFALELAAELQLSGKTLVDRLDEIYVRHGFFYETQFVQVCLGAQGSTEIAAMMRALRNQPPAKLGTIVFETVRDYQRHEIRSLPSNTFQSTLAEPSGDLLILEGRSGDCRVTLAGRPSGTEPKIKFYLFANVSPKLALPDARRLGQSCLAGLEVHLKDWLNCVVPAKSSKN